ncbi:hypothetical protein [Nitratifractor sp.]|uniref:hypothetical protein n=1 Tax=Nitratifractor sp. TaxID=2268144 RepID=UPI0025FE9F8B|nr:hypothetical protein [Nitratifractor sp.]
MKTDTERTKWLPSLLLILGTVILIKLIWVSLEIFYLPSYAPEKKSSTQAKALRYHLSIASNASLHQRKQELTAHKITSLKGYTLEATYLDSKVHLAVVSLRGHAFVLREGDRIQGGFLLKKVESGKVIFEKDGHNYILKMKQGKKETLSFPNTIHYARLFTRRVHLDSGNRFPVPCFPSMENINDRSGASLSSEMPPLWEAFHV